MYRLLTASALVVTACAAPANSRETTEQAAANAPAASTSDATAKPRLVVHKDPNCGCCTNWVDHMRANGFEVVVHDMPSVEPEKRRLGVPARLASCHTGEVGGYAIEGHVPADLVKRLLQERPAVAGLAVPGMPVGSPGMEGAYSERYDIIAFTREGTTSVYASR